MNKIDYQQYLNRWKLVAEVEKNEIKKASFELLVQQTFSIWDIGRTLGFSDSENTSPNHLWTQLQRKWKDQHA